MLTRDLNDSVRDARRPEDPSPRRVLGDETTNDWPATVSNAYMIKDHQSLPDRGPEQRSQSIDTDSLAAICMAKEISHHATSDSHGAAATQSTQEAKGDHLPFRACKATAKIES